MHTLESKDCFAAAMARTETADTNRGSILNVDQSTNTPKTLFDCHSNENWNSTIKLNISCTESILNSVYFDFTDAPFFLFFFSFFSRLGGKRNRIISIEICNEVHSNGIWSDAWYSSITQMATHKSNGSVSMEIDNMLCIWVGRCAKLDLCHCVKNVVNFMCFIHLTKSISISKKYLLILFWI